MKWKIPVVAVVLAVALYFGLRSCDRTTEVAETPTPVTEVDSLADSTGAPGPDGRLVDVGGHRLLVRTFGDGAPAIVIEPGIGESAGAWASVIDALDGEYRVVLYDRAGYGGSDPGPLPRTADRVARELDALLQATPIDPPYIVVGHSIGALDALVFASEHPNVVDGLVLLDPPPVDFIRGRRFPELRATADEMTAGFRRDAESARAAGDTLKAKQLDAIASEHEEMFGSGGPLIASITSLGDMPLVVVASGVPNPHFEPHAEEFQRFWRASSEDLTRLSTRSDFIYAAQSTHNLPADAPETVVQAIRACIDLGYAPASAGEWDEEK